MATFTVTTTAASGAGSLRAAVALANADASADEIVFDASLAGKTIVLTGGPLVLSTNIAIDGDVNGDHKADITLSGGGVNSILVLQGQSTNIDLDSLTLSGGNAGSQGGAIEAIDIATLDIHDCTIAGNRSSTSGGGIIVSDTVTSITNSLVLGNYSISGGGGIAAAGGSLTITNSTIAENASYGGGAGISAGNITLTILDSTITGNHAASGTGYYASGGGLSLGSGYMIVSNTVIAENTSGNPNTMNDVAGTINLGVKSIFGSVVSVATNFYCSQSVTNVGLGELLDNGGTVLTRAPLDGSILIDAGQGSTIPTDDYDVDHDGDKLELLPLDGRGLGRMWNGTVDVGAVEYFATDTIRGTSAANHIFGGIGNDLLSGLGGDDVISGGADNDTISGGSGSDRISGDGGKDKMSGDGGRDAFVFASLADTARSLNGADRVMDFVQKQDRIDLSAIDGDGAGMSDAFDFVGSHAFSKTAGELRVAVSGSDLVISGDANGDGRADFSIILVGDSNLVLTARDFIL